MFPVSLCLRFFILSIHIRAPSSATGISLVPPVARTIFPMPSETDICPIMPQRASPVHINFRIADVIKGLCF
jgi:hypothetical protein